MKEFYQGKISKDYIIHTAANLFKEKGYRATSMEDIASAMGVKKSSLYYYFRSKEELLYEIGRLTMELLLKSGEKTTFSSLPPGEKVRSFIFSHIHLICENMHLFTTSLLELNPTNIPYYWKEIVALRDRYEGLLRDIVKVGIEAKVFRKIDEKMIVIFILGAMNWLIRWYNPKGSLSPNKVASIWQDIFLNGLLATDDALKD